LPARAHRRRPMRSSVRIGPVMAGGGGATAAVGLYTYTRTRSGGPNFRMRRSSSTSIGLRIVPKPVTRTLCLRASYPNRPVAAYVRSVLYTSASRNHLHPPANANGKDAERRTRDRTSALPTNLLDRARRQGGGGSPRAGLPLLRLRSEEASEIYFPSATSSAAMAENARTRHQGTLKVSREKLLLLAFLRRAITPVACPTAHARGTTKGSAGKGRKARL